MMESPDIPIGKEKDSFCCFNHPGLEILLVFKCQVERKIILVDVFNNDLGDMCWLGEVFILTFQSTVQSAR